jgi:hypothetical protein
MNLRVRVVKMSNPQPATHRDLLVGRLVGLAAQLDAIVAYVDSEIIPEPGGPGAWVYGLREVLSQPRAQEVLRRWRSVFREELDLVRRARNSVAHGRDIGDDNLENAVTFAQRLLDLAMEPFTQAGPGSIFEGQE